MESRLSEIDSSKMFDGYNKRYKHYSDTLGCSMTFTIYFPPSASSSHKSPVCHNLPSFFTSLISISYFNFLDSLIVSTVNKSSFVTFLNFHSYLHSSCYFRTTDWLFKEMILLFYDWQVLYWLSGLTCTDENFIIKSGAQRSASTHGIALVVPDTSPSEPAVFSFVWFAIFVLWFIIFPWFLTLCDGFWYCRRTKCWRRSRQLRLWCRYATLHASVFAFLALLFLNKL